MNSEAQPAKPISDKVEKNKLKKLLHWKKMTLKRDKKSLTENIYRPCIRNETNTLTLQEIKIIPCK